jgi:putative ABC transport system permease protein
MLVSFTTMILFAGVIAFGSMVNNSLIEIGDRMRDISTFRVLGYRPNQVAGIFLRQNLIIFAVGLILAFPIAYGMVVGIARAYDTELFRMPVVIRPNAFIWTTLISIVFVLIAQWVVYRQIHKLDWLEGVKVQE